MIEQDEAFVEDRRRFFQQLHSQTGDAWHEYSQKIIESTTREWFEQFSEKPVNRILNAGSGGRAYGIDQRMTHLDLFESNLGNVEERLVANIADIPSENRSFDVAICVGSVLNYADPVRAIRELERVLRSGGVLILEYERSGSFEHLMAAKGGRSCVRVLTFYGDSTTHLWVYSDGFIDGLLSVSGFCCLAQRRFHALSSVVLAATRSAQIGSWFTLGDRFLAQRWPLRAIASNRILALKKLSD